MDFSDKNKPVPMPTSERLVTAQELVDFARVLSHNLRDSLGLVNAFADLAAAHETAVDEDLARLLTTVQRNGRLSLHIIDQLHILAHAYVGTPVRPDTFDLLSAIVAVQQNMSLYAPHLDMKMVLADWYPLVSAVPTWVEEALFGIVWFFGSLKREPFTINVTCERTADEMAVLRIQGPAVSSAVEARVAVRRKVDDMREVDLDGHGMPIHVVRLLLERMGGGLSVLPSHEDDSGRLTFVCRLPSPLLSEVDGRAS